MKPASTTLTLIGVVVCALALGATIRILTGVNELLWLDELHTSWVVGSSLSEVYGRSADGNQAPLFFWLSWFPVNLLGPSELSVRLVAIVSGLGLIVAAAQLVWRWTNSVVAVTTTLVFIVFDLQFVFYGTEARPYVLIQLLSVIQAGLFFRAILPGSAKGSEEPEPFSTRAPDWGLAFVSAVLIYVHPTSIWIFVSEVCFAGLYSAWCRLKKLDRHRPALPRLVFTALVAFVLCFPVLIQMFSVFGRRGNWSLVSSPANVLFDQRSALLLMMGGPLICLFVFQFVQRVARSTHESASQTSRLPDSIWKLIFLLLWALVPTASVISVAWLEIAPIALSRYALVGSAAFPIFAGMVVAQIESLPKRVALSILLTGIFLWQNPIARMALAQRKLPVLRVEDWQTPIAASNIHGPKASHPVFLFANVIEDIDSISNPDPQFQEYLLFPVKGLYPIATDQRAILARPTIAREHFAENDTELIARQGGSWIVVRGNLELLNEIAAELRQRLSHEIEIEPDKIQFNLLDTPFSPVYLISVDW